MGGLVIQNIERVAEEIIDGLRSCGVSTVHDTRKKRIASELYLTVIPGQGTGSAITILAPPADN